VDPLTDEDVRSLRWCRLYIDQAADVLDRNLHFDNYRRAYPGPELREIRRKLSTARAMIEELL
jgi:hypothetical protein